MLMVGLALVGALAVACFVKAVGVVFLGRPRGNRAKTAEEASPRWSPATRDASPSLHGARQPLRSC